MTLKEKISLAYRQGKIKNETTLNVFLMIEELKQKIDDELPNIKNILNKIKGDKGDKPTRQEILDLIKPLIPKPIKGDKGEMPSDKELLKIIKPLIPKVKNGETPTKQELLDIILPLIPEIDYPKIITESVKRTSDELLPKIPTIQQIVENIPMESERVRDALELLMGDDRLDASAIRGLPELKKEIHTIGLSRGLNVYVGGDKKGLLNTIDFVGDDVSYSKVNGRDTLTFTSESENLFDRTGTVLSPHNAGDSLDMGTGGITAGLGTFGSTYQSIFGDQTDGLSEWGGQITAVGKPQYGATDGVLLFHEYVPTIGYYPISYHSSDYMYGWSIDEYGYFNGTAAYAGNASTASYANAGPTGSGAKNFAITSTDHSSAAISLMRTGSGYIDFRLINSVGHFLLDWSNNDGSSWTTGLDYHPYITTFNFKANNITTTGIINAGTLYMNDDNFIGIGTGTGTVPNFKMYYDNANGTKDLVIAPVTDAGTVRINGAGTPTLLLQAQHSTRPSLEFKATGADGGVAFNIMKGTVVNTGLYSSTFGAVGLYGSGSSGTSAPVPYYMYFDARTTAACNMATLKVDAENRVGIGISSSTRPSATLDVGGTLTVDGATGDLTTTGNLIIDSDTNSLQLGADQDILLSSDANGVINIASANPTTTDITTNWGVGATNVGVMKWMEDEDYFDFQDVIKLPYLGGAPATLVNGMVWMEADGLHAYYDDAEHILAD